MAKMRVYELANSLGIEVERAIRLLQQVGASPRNHMSVVERVPARRVRQLLKQNKNAALPETQLQQVEPVIVAPPPGEAVAETDGAAKKAEDPPRERPRPRLPRRPRRTRRRQRTTLRLPRSPNARKRHRQLRGPPPVPPSPRLWTRPRRPSRPHLPRQRRR